MHTHTHTVVLVTKCLFDHQISMCLFSDKPRMAIYFSDILISAKMLVKPNQPVGQQGFQRAVSSSHHRIDGRNSHFWPWRLEHRVPGYTWIHCRKCGHFCTNSLVVLDSPGHHWAGSKMLSSICRNL